MKTVAFMAALLMGSAAVAQTTPPTTPAPDATMQPGTTTAPTPPADNMTPPPAPDAPAAPADPMATTAAPAPMAPPAPPAPMAGAPMAGQQIQFAPPQMTPPPPAKDSYPVCTRTLKDGCRNPGGR